MEDFGLLSKTVSNTLFTISSNVQTLQKMAVQLGTPADNHDLRTDLYVHFLTNRSKAPSRAESGRLVRSC